MAAVLCVTGYVYVYGTGLADAVIRSDGFSYYVYVPSWLLYRDPTLSEVARDCCGGVYPADSGIFRWPGTRRWVNVHPIGVAMMQAPVFPLAHALTRWSNLTPDGFSLYYQHAAGFAGLMWALAGLLAVRTLLLQFFADPLVGVTLLVTLAGTNLLHYATFDVSYSHVYSFFLFAAFLILCSRWHTAPSEVLSVLLGCTAGMIVLTRHTNATFLLFFPLFGITSRPTAQETLARLLHNWKHVALIGAAAALVVLPQLAIYYQATGRLVVSAYGDQGFNWTAPRVFDVLFSVTKGLFFWSPLLLLSVAGFVHLWRSAHPARAFVPPALAFLAIHTYLIASWWDWQLGGSYGSRGFVDALAVFAIGLAGFFQRVWTTMRARIAVAVIVSAGVALSLFQMTQYWYGIIPFTDTTWELYREVFLRWR